MVAGDQKDYKFLQLNVKNVSFLDQIKRLGKAFNKRSKTFNIGTLGIAIS